jgi:cytochrome P450
MSTQIFIAVAALSVIGTWAYQNQTRRVPRYPPGPKPDFLIGNLRQVPREKGWLGWTEFGKQYGPLTYLNVMGRPILVLNSHDAAVDLLEKRGKIYSERASAAMLDLVGRFHICLFLVRIVEPNFHAGGRDLLTSLLPYGDVLRKHRKVMNSVLSPREVDAKWSNIQEIEAHELLRSLLERPTDFLEGVAA